MEKLIPKLCRVLIESDVTINQLLAATSLGFVV